MRPVQAFFADACSERTQKGSIRAEEALARRDALEQRKKLARDYAAGAADAQELLADFEAAQLDLLRDDE